jgi:CO/xanthine dehydrogenase FAD-binding subunit
MFRMRFFLFHSVLYKASYKQNNQQNALASVLESAAVLDSSEHSARSTVRWLLSGAADTPMASIRAFSAQQLRFDFAHRINNPTRSI